MIRLAADENVDGNIVNGVLRREPDADLVYVQQAGLTGTDDPTLLGVGRGRGPDRAHARRFDHDKVRL
jgi:hypothetical protein